MSEITKLAAALVKAQAAMTGAKKDSNNPFFKSKYADLSSVDAAIGPALEKHGLAYIQRSHSLDNAAGIETIIIHESGESLSCGVVSVPVAKHDAQAFGSAMTYARRYSLSAAFGVCPEDDDGNAATVAKPEEPKGRKPVPASFKYWNELSDGDKIMLLPFREEMTELVAKMNYTEAAAVYDAVKEFTRTDGSVLFEDDSKPAIWSCFNSVERDQIKKFSKYMTEKGL